MTTARTNSRAKKAPAARSRARSPSTAEPPAEAPAKTSRARPARSGKTTTAPPASDTRVVLHHSPVQYAAARDVHVHAAATSSPPPPLDVAAYLKDLLHDVEHIEIAGIASRPGRSSDALVSRIEDLYTPLSSRPRPFSGAVAARLT